MGKGKDKDGICMADGGITRQETADELMARMTAKYGAPAAEPAPQQPAPVAQTPPQTKPVPTQPASSGQGILGILRGRKEAIDKAANFANGGIVSGKGTPTSDDVPVKIKGRDYNLSDTEAVLPSKSRQALGEMLGAEPGNVAQANALVEKFIEQTNGKPPVSVEEGTNLADGGLLDEEARKMNYQAVTGTPTPAPIPAPTAAPAQPTDGISLGKSPAPTIYGNGGLPPDVVERGINTMRGQLAKPQSPAPAAMGPAAVQAQTVDDGAGGVYTPGGGAIPPDKAGSGILNGIVGFFEDSARAARGEKSYEQLRADRSAGQVTPPTAAPAASMNDGRVAVKADPFGPKPEQFSTPANSDGTFMTGKAKYDETGLNQTGMSTPDSSGGGFVQKNVSYNVNPTSQEGITKITSSKTNPLFTNIRPEDAVASLKNQAVGAQDVQEGLNRHARANAITKSIIDAQPAGGVGILGDGGVEAANAEKTARWRQDDLLQQAKYGNRAAGDAIQANAKLAGDQIHSATAQRGQDITANVTTRGQDIHAQTEADRLAGNPVDNQLKKAQTRGILAQSSSSEAIAELQQKAIAGDANAAATLRALTGKGQASDRYLTVAGGEEIGPDGMTKIKKPSGVFDAQTQKFVPMDGGGSGQQQAPAAAVDFLKKNPNQAAAFKAKYGYLPEGF